MRMRLVDDARRAWTWFSMWALAALAALPLLWEALPPEVVAVIPHEWRAWILAIIAVAGMIGRLVPQGRD